MRFLPRWHRASGVYLTVLAVAAAVRLILFFSFLSSPVRYFSYIAGLDMKTILDLGVMFRQGEAAFSIDRLVSMLTYVLGGNRIWPEGFVVIQMALGCGTALCITYTILHLTGKRIAACVGGILAACYVPCLVYELITLRESIHLFFAAMALALTLAARRGGTPTWLRLLSGAAIILPAYLRFSSIIWVPAALLWLALCLRKKRLGWRGIVRHLSPVVLGAGIAVAVAGGINRCNSGEWQWFAISSGHASLVTAIASRENLTEVNPETLSVPGQRKYWNMVARIPRHCFDLVKPFEISNNINYYFVKPLFPILKYLPGSLLVIPLATTGLLLLLFRGGWHKKESVVFFYFAAYALPLILYVPLSRYRLILLPAFCLGLAYLARLALKLYFERNLRGRLALAGVMMLALMVFIITAPKSFPVRVADYTTLGKAMEIRDRKITPGVVECYRNAWQLDPESIPAAYNLGRVLLMYGNTQDAAVVLAPAWKRHPDNFSITIYYANALSGNGRPGEALKALSRLRKPDTDEQKMTFFYTLGECYRLNGDKEKAKQAYEQALSCARNDAPRRNIQRLIETLR